MTRAVFFLLSMTAAACFADVEYNAETATVIAVDCSEQKPGTLGELLVADRKHGWGKVSYNQPTDTYTVAAHLQIGLDDASDTFFQIGSPGHMDETLVVVGKAVEGYTNTVRIGRETDPRVGPNLRDDPDNKVAQPTVTINCSKNKKFCLRGGWFHFYNLTLSAADPKYPFGGNVPRQVKYRDSLVLHANGLNYREGIVADNTVFRYGHIGLMSPPDKRTIVGCAFQGYVASVMFLGASKLRLYHCVFGSRNNKWSNNWNYHLNYGGNLTLVNCLLYGSGILNDYEMTRGTYILLHSVFTDRKCLRVKVTDETGAPLEGAKVTVSNEQVDGEVQNPEGITGKDGMTLPPRNLNAIFVLTYRRESTGERGGTPPMLSYFTYKVEVARPATSPARLPEWGLKGRMTRMATTGTAGFHPGMTTSGRI